MKNTLGLRSGCGGKVAAYSGVRVRSGGVGGVIASSWARVNKLGVTVAAEEVLDCEDMRRGV